MKGRNAKDLRGIDRNDPRYWEEVLRREGLTQDAGRHKKLVYVGNSLNLENIASKGKLTNGQDKHNMGE